MSKANKTYSPIGIDRLGAAAMLWTALNMAADVVNVVVAGIDLYLLTRPPWGTPLGPLGEFPVGNDLSVLTALVRMAVIVVAIVAGFIVLKWIYRANRNAHAFATGLNTPPPWAVGWFFVPVAFLWKPFGAMSETWRASHDPAKWKTGVVPGLLRVWWGFWLSGILAGNLSFRAGLRAENTANLAVATALELISAVLTLGAGLALRSIIRRITARQTDLIAARVAQTQSPSAPLEASTAENPPVDPSRPWG
jgi:hypothetical protein